VQEGKEAVSLIDSGILTGLSVGFDVVKVETERRGGDGPKGYEVDRIIEANLAECRNCSFPAIDGARILSNRNSTAAATFAVTESNGKRERLQRGDFVRLATFTRGRVEPDLLAEDAQHPGARAELQRILGGNLRR